MKNASIPVRVPLKWLNQTLNKIKSNIILNLIKILFKI